MLSLAVAVDDIAFLGLDDGSDRLIPHKGDRGLAYDNPGASALRNFRLVRRARSAGLRALRELH